MESIYLAERTWRKPYHLLSLSFITSGPKSRPVVPPVNTNLASTHACYPQHTLLHSGYSAATGSPYSPDNSFTPYPLPTTAATTPATSPLQKVEAKLCVDVKSTGGSVIQPKYDELGPEAKMLRSFTEYFEVWIKRYMEEMIHGRQLEEKLCGGGEGFLVGEHF